MVTDARSVGPYQGTSVKTRTAFAFSLSSSAPIALDEGKQDAWVEIAKLGEWKGYVGPDGKRRTIKITPDHFASALAEFSRCENDMALDYEHQSTTGGEAPAAGWIDDLKVDGDRLTAHVTFTTRAADAVRAREYRYTSPVWSINAPDRVTGETLLAQIPCVALTNVPFQDGLRPVSLSRLVRMAQSLDGIPEGDPSMTPEENQALLDAVMKELGVTDPKTLLAAVQQLAGEAKAEADAAGAPMSMPAAMSRIGAQRAELSALRSSLATATKALEDRRAADEKAAEEAKAKAAADAKAAAEKASDDAIQAAIASGKILPTARAEYAAFARSDLAGFNALVAKLPEIVPMSKRAPKQESAPASSVDVADPIVASFKRAGWSDEKIAKALAKHGTH